MLSRTKFPLRESPRKVFIIKKCLKCYVVVTYATKCKKISKQIGEIKGIYINETNIKGYSRFPAKLNTAHGEVARMQINCCRQNSGNSTLFFQHLSFQSYY